MDKLILNRTSNGKISKFKNNLTNNNNNSKNLINLINFNFNYRLNFSIFFIFVILNFIINETSAIILTGDNNDHSILQKETIELINTSDYNNSKIILESAKLRHNGNNNEYNIGKHDGDHRKFRSTNNNQQQKRNIENPLRIDGFRIEENPKKSEEPGDDGIPIIYSSTDVVIRVFGTGFTEHTYIAFSHEENEYGGSCLVTSTGLFSIESLTDKTALFKINLPISEGKIFYFCAKNDEHINDPKDAKSTEPLIHQGSDTWLRIKSFEPFLPLWASVAIILTCLTFSALFSGLNLGLMSLDRTELKILRNTGSANEQMYATKIQPVRDHGNYLLCSILLGNVLVNSTFTILLDSLTSGLVAVISSTIAIVIFGEITPQAICSRHGLAVGAKTIFITKAVMLITFPLAYPTSKILDYILGEEIGNVYNRERLKELVKVTNDVNDLDKNEVNIISGALELRKKTVGDVMTHIDDAFMLSLNAILDFETVSEIMKSGYSRIPVYDGERKNIVTLLYIKDLAFVDPDDNTPLKTLCEFYQNPCHFVFEDVTLDIMFNQFKEGNKGHIAFVHRVNNEGEGDPFYETIGLVTLEDVIEELIQAEIIDETDVFMDNRTKIRRQKIQKQDFTIFAERRENQKIRISPQLTLATFQYLSTSVDAFKKDSISETILRRLLNQDIVNNIKHKGKDRNDPTLLIYEQGTAVDFFVLILEGRVEVTVGREHLVFESGPFTYFGTQALVQNFSLESLPQAQQFQGSLQSLIVDAKVKHTFTPDYSVRAVCDVIYIAIKRSLYLAAKRATLLEISQKFGEDPSSDPIDDEVEKLLHSLEEDDRSIRNNTNTGGRHTPKNQHHTIHAIINNDNNKFVGDGSNSPSPTHPASVSIVNLIRRKNQDDHRNDHILYATKDSIQPNGPQQQQQQQQSASSPNSLQTSFNQNSASLLGSQQTSSNSMAVIPNLSSMDDNSCDEQQQISPRSGGGGRGSGFISIDFADASDSTAAGGDNIEHSNIGVIYTVGTMIDQKDDNNITTADTPLLIDDDNKTNISGNNSKC